MTDTAIATEGLTKQYTNIRALTDLNLEVQQGEIFGFLGPNGAGKTTTIRLLLDLIRPTSGRAEILGYDCRRQSQDVRSRVGYLPGDLRLYHRLSGRQLVDFVSSLRTQPVDSGYVAQLAERLNLDLHGHVGAYSKGRARSSGCSFLASLPGFLIGAGLTGLGAHLGVIFPAVINMLPLVFLFLAFSLWASAALPTRGTAAALAIGLVVATYFFNVVGAAVQDVDFLRRLSPFYWADAAHVLMRGFDWARAGGLLSIACLFLVLAVWSFGRREVMSGTREWSVRSLLPSTR